MPQVVDNETDEDIDNTILAVKPKLKRSPSEPKETKPRTPAQIAALEKARASAKEKADQRRAAKPLPPVSESSTTEPIDIPQDEDSDDSITTVAPKRKTTSYRRPIPEDNGWKAFAEFLVDDRRNSKAQPSLPEPNKPEPAKKEPPKSVKVIPPQKEQPAPKKKPIFS